MYHVISSIECQKNNKKSMLTLRNSTALQSNHSMQVTKHKQNIIVIN
ncbi:unnamed protein product [Schistosoma mattheei]|uniref:Uncharacterized protein n=1 Tax=Schistosoma mattheei TaxID=31246 RepID=A0A3P8ISA8_9TREM|nr:unnamed protein product [Schistosoma mattheei]